MVDGTFKTFKLSTVLTSSPVPLYAQVADRLRQHIATGLWTPGQRIPLEALAQEFGVARVTARQAVQTLSDAQLLVARHWHHGGRKRVR